MRDQLIRTQERSGHAKGSWYVPSAYSGRGGRLYYTAMATLILQTYYRYPRVYDDRGE